MVSWSVVQVRFFKATPRFLLRGSCCQRKLLIAYNFAVLSRIVLWQHVDDLWPLGSFSKEKWPAHAGAQT